jgi:hypothetical protein
LDGHDDPLQHTHELRTALTGIKAHAQLLLRHLRRTGSVDPDRLRWRTETIDQLTGRMIDAISCVEDYFKRNGGTTNGPQRDRQ